MIQNCTNCQWLHLTEDNICTMPLSSTYPEVKKCLTDPCDAYDPKKPVKPKVTHNCIECKYLKSTNTGQLLCEQSEKIPEDLIACNTFQNKNASVPKILEKISQKVIPKKIIEKPKIKVGERKVRY